MTKRKKQILTLSAIMATAWVINASSQSLWQLCGNEDVYFLGKSVSQVLLAYAAARVVRMESYLLFIVLDLFFDLAINDLLDELLFDPKKWEWNEYIVATVSLLFVLGRLLVYARKTKPKWWMQHFLWVELTLMKLFPTIGRKKLY